MAFSIAFKKIGAKANDALLKGLDGDDDKARQTSVDIIANGARSPIFIPSLLKLLKHEKATIRYSSVVGLMYSKEKQNLITSALIACLGDSDEQVQREIAITLAYYLARLEPEHPFCTSLEKALDSDNPEVRKNALQTFAQLSDFSKPFLAKIITKATDQNSEVRKTLIDALIRIDHSGSVVQPILADFLQDSNVSVQLAALKEIDYLPKKTEQTIDQLLAAFKNTSEISVKKALIEVLLNIKNHPKTQAILLELQDQDRYPQEIILFFLSGERHIEKEWIPIIIKNLNSTNLILHALAKRILLRIERKEVIQELIKNLSHTNNYHRIAVIKIFLEQGVDAPELVPYLADLLRQNISKKEKIEICLALENLKQKEKIIYYLQNLPTLPAREDYEKAHAQQKQQIIERVEEYYNYTTISYFLEDYYLCIDLYKTCLEYLTPENQANTHYDISCCYSICSLKLQSLEKKQHIELALDHLEKSIELGFSNLEYLRKDPDLKALHTEIRYQQILKK